MSKNLLGCFVVVLTIMAFYATSESHAQRPSLQELIQNVDRKATDQEESKSFFGFQKVKMPKPLEGLVDLRFKKPTLPKFAFLDKLKNIGKPSFGDEPTSKGPILTGLGKLFSPEPKNTPGFFDRMFGRQPEASSGELLLSESDRRELNGIAQGLQSQAKRMSREAQNNVRDLFAPAGTPQPPYRTARQYQDNNTSRY